MLQGNIDRDGDRERGRVLKNRRAVTVPVELNSQVMSDRLNGVPARDVVAVRNRAALAAIPSSVRRRVVFIERELVVNVEFEEKPSCTWVIF